MRGGDTYHLKLDVRSAKVTVYVNGKRYRWWHRLLRRLPRERNAALCYGSDAPVDSAYDVEATFSDALDSPKEESRE